MYQVQDYDNNAAHPVVCKNTSFY